MRAKNGERHLYSNFSYSNINVNKIMSSGLRHQTLKNAPPIVVVKNSSAKVSYSHTLYTGLLSLLNSVFSFSISLPQETYDVELSEISNAGQFLVKESEILRDMRRCDNEKGTQFTITKKQALCLGSVLIGAAFAGTGYYRNKQREQTQDRPDTRNSRYLDFYPDTRVFSEHSSKDNQSWLTSPPFLDDNRSFAIPDSITGDWEISESEYQRDVAIINGLVVSFFDNNNAIQISEARGGREKRATRQAFIKNKNIVNEILKLMSDEKIDWHLRNEFDLIFRRAESSLDIKKIKKRKERNVKILLKCIQFTHAYIYSDFVNEASRLSLFCANIYLAKLWRIVDGLSRSDKSLVGSLIKMHNEIAKGKFTHFSFVNENHWPKSISKKKDKKTKLPVDVYQTPSRKDNVDSYFNAVNRTRQGMHILKKRIYAPKEINKKEGVNSDGVTKIKITNCRDEREVLSIQSILRIISKTVKSPVTSLIEEGRIILHYDIYGIGCTDDDDFNTVARKIESAVDNLLSWLPNYNKTRLVTLIFSTVLDMIADSIEKKELSISYIEDIENYTLSLAKDIVSSLLTKTVNDIASKNDETHMAKIVNSIEHKNNNLVIKTQAPEKRVYIERVANHFADKETKGLIFYNNRNHWVVDKNIIFNNEVKDTFNLAKVFWTNAEKIYFFKNSSPNIYGDAILIRFNSLVYALVGNVFKSVIEIQISESIFRYVARSEKGYLPIVQRAGKWIFESEHNPLASDALISFMRSNKGVKNELINAQTQHNSVGPLSVARKYQFDKNHKKFLKIDNEYFEVKIDDSLSIYIEGAGDLLPLKLENGKFHIKTDIFSDVYSLTKRPLDQLLSRDEHVLYFFDNTIVTTVANTDILVDATPREGFRSYEYAKNIDGAMICEGETYLPYDNKLIKITANGDDTYILGDPIAKDKSILICKNPKSTTYFLMPEKATLGAKRDSYKSRPSRCLTKRQTFSPCTADFYESKDIRTLLRTHITAGVKFDSPSEILKPYVGVNGFFNNMQRENALYYWSDNNVFFHAREEPESDELIPTYFKLYGKSNDGSLDPNFLITDVSVVKDFGTQKIIITTPSEAQEMVFSLERDLSDKLLKWQQGHSGGSDFNVEAANLEQLSYKLFANKNMNDVYKMIERSGKKVITSVEQANHYIEEKKKMIFENVENYHYKNLDLIEKEHEHDVISNILVQAFDKTKATLSAASYLIDSNKPEFNDYMLNKLGFSEVNSLDYFSNVLHDKLRKIKVIFSEERKDNIIVIVKKNRYAMIDRESNDNILGFSYVNDPLDRIFINAESIPDDFSPDEREYQGYAQQQYYVNLIADTMRHEAVHALGSPDDYFYLRVDEEGNLEDVEASVARIEYHILMGKMLNDKFMYLCKNYFMTNPVYNEYNIESLLVPSTLYQIFKRDDYLRMIFFINNPDTLSLIIRDLAKRPIFPHG